MSATAPTPTTPKPCSALLAPDPGTGGRVEALDVLRGIAILGTLASNIWIFTGAIGTDANRVIPQWLGDISQWLPNGKFLGLLTIMFGIGLEIQRQAALRHGKKWPGAYPVRAGLLFVDGLLNYIFVVQFDVLRAYAFTGLIVAFLLLTSERVQWWLIGIFLTAHFALMAVTATNSTLNTGADWSNIGTVLEEEAGTGYWGGVLDTIRNLGSGFDINSEFFTIVMMGIGLFLLGAKLYRIGIFTPARRQLRYWLIGSGFLIALPVDYILSHTDIADGMFSSHARYGAAACVALGILALVAEFYQHRTPGYIGRHLAFVGKMALTCYLLQNIIGVILQNTVLSHDALTNVDNTLATYLSFTAISLFLITFARLWLTRSSRGPFELAWNWCYRKITRSR